MSVVKKPVFAVFDEKAGMFLDPFAAATEGVAVRDFSAAVNGGVGPLGEYPGDFTLYRLGYVTNVGELIGDYGVVINGLACKQKEIFDGRKENGDDESVSGSTSGGDSPQFL